MSLINQQIDSFGSLSQLQIDSRQRTMAARLVLKGEPAPIDVQAGTYEVVQEDGCTYLVFRNFGASKEWIAAVLNRYVAGRKFRAPELIRSVL